MFRQSLKYQLILLSIFASFPAYPVKLPEILTNAIYSSHFKSVQLYPEGESLSPPVLTLNSDQILYFTFDDLSSDAHNYYYTIYHCDRNWKLSKIPQEEYLPSFTDYPLDDFDVSINTKVKYLNYRLTIPNHDIPLKYSGNYILVVFDKDNPDEPLITRRFFVVESIVGINARIRNDLFDTKEGGKQEIDFVILKNGLQIRNSKTDIKVVIQQNNRTDNVITGLAPIYEDDIKLDYDYDKGNSFTGDNEYRQFEFRGINFPGKGVADISFHQPLFHMTLETDQPRVWQRYSFDREINGLYRIEMYKSDIPEIEADYMSIHFTLKSDNPFPLGGVYVFGELTNWDCSETNEMAWNAKTRQYELTLLLKQGFYNYSYAFKDSTDNKIKIGSIEGSFSQTENDYQIYVYYGKNTDRYDRLIGYKKFNSLINRSYLQ